jgi:hypothetical protein
MKGRPLFLAPNIHTPHRLMRGKWRDRAKGVHSLALERNEHSLSRIHNREKMMVARQHMVLLGQFTVVVEDDTPIFS